jgi:hypothetical protein
MLIDHYYGEMKRQYFVWTRPIERIPDREFYGYFAWSMITGYGCPLLLYREQPIISLVSNIFVGTALHQR